MSIYKYSNIKKPAIYVPLFDYYQSIGKVKYTEQADILKDIHLLNPTKTHYPEIEYGQDTVYEVKADAGSFGTYKEWEDTDGYIYIFILGHNLKKMNCGINIELLYDGQTYQPDITSTYPIVNYNQFTDSSGTPDWNGFSIFKTKYNVTSTNSAIDGFRIRIRPFSPTGANEFIKLGCVSICKKWTPPHNPDLSVKMSREYDGVKTTQTKGGATLSNALYTRGGTFWANGYSWELSGSDDDYNNPSDMADRGRQRTLGRRNWDLTFSYLKPSDLMPEFESLDYYGVYNNINADDQEDAYSSYEEQLGRNITTSNSFFAAVLNKVQGSHIPFIFQPNVTDPNNNADQWAICRFNQKKFDITQKAPELYNMKLKIRETY